MDEFTKQIVELINSEVDKRAEKIVRERLNEVVKNLANFLSVNDIAWATDLSVTEVRVSLQEIVDIQNNILRLCGKADELETIETFFNLDKAKVTIKTDGNEV